MNSRLLVAVLLLGLVGCAASTEYGAAKTVVVRQEINELEKEEVPGTQHDVWEEPMPAIVRVPAQLDPRGIIWRKSQNTIVEVRPGKYQQVQFPDYDGNYRNPK